MKRAKIVFLAAALMTTAAQTAMAQQPLPSETVKQKAATTGATDVAKGGFAAGTTLPSDEDPKQATQASISAGGLFSSGNAKSIALTTAGSLKVRRDEHQFSMAVAANFARAGKTGEPVETSVENYQGLLRYDYFITNNLALFLQNQDRRDRFQGLDLRFQVDPGLAYYIINTKKQILRTEVGYDLQHDVRRDESRVQTPPAAAPGAPPPAPLPLVDKTQTLHNLRLFGGYENQLYKEVSLVSSLEYLQAVTDLGTYRLVFNVGIKSNISNNLAIATTYTMRYENKPLPGVVNTDSIASINLVYTLF